MVEQPTVNRQVKGSTPFQGACLEICYNSIVIISVHNVEKEIKVTSIILESDPDHPNNFSMFYCPKCRDGLLQYSGHIVMIVPGYTPTPIPFIRQCRQCKSKYLIVSII